MSNEDQEKESPKISVVDRRFWARSDESGDDEETPKKPSYVADLEARLEEKDQLLNEIRSKHRAAVKEFEDSKARLGRDVQGQVEQNRRSTLVELLDVLDNLERAVEAANENADVETLLQGVAMVRDQFVAKLASLGVFKQSSLNKKFDPEQHEAVSVIPVTQSEQDGVVLGVVQEGYLLGDQVLRPATVAVGRAANDQVESEAEGASGEN